MAGRFELLEELGTGGMGTVWKARDRDSGQVVALKLLHRQFVPDSEYVARFEREVEIAQRVDSPFVVKVLGFGRQDGTPFVAMEYIEGRSLKDAIREGGPIAWDGPGRRMAIEVTRGLAAAHAAGVIHRDVKPSNILLDAEGGVHLADFGIARAADFTRMTGSLTVLGTPAYMAPDRALDERSDLYALGCVLFEMLAGEPPFAGETQQQVLLAHMRDAPDLSRLPAGARRIVGWLLAKEPGKRPGSATALLAVLEGSMPGGARIPANRVGPPLRWAAAGVLGVAAIGTGLAFAALRDGGDGGAANGATSGDEPKFTTTQAATTSTRLPSATVPIETPQGIASETPAGGTPSPSSTPTTTTSATATLTPTATATSAPAAEVSPTADTRPVSFVWDLPNSAVAPGEAFLCWVAIPIGTSFDVEVVRMGSEIVAFHETATASETPQCFLLRTLVADVPEVRLELKVKAVHNGSDFTKYHTLKVSLPSDYVAGAPPTIDSVTLLHSAPYAGEPNVWFSVNLSDLDRNAARVDWRVIEGEHAPSSGSRADLFDDFGHGTVNIPFSVACGAPLTVGFTFVDHSGQSSAEGQGSVVGAC